MRHAYDPDAGTHQSMLRPPFATRPLLPIIPIASQVDARAASTDSRNLSNVPEARGEKGKDRLDIGRQGHECGDECYIGGANSPRLCQGRRLPRCCLPHGCHPSCPLPGWPCHRHHRHRRPACTITRIIASYLCIGSHLHQEEKRRKAVSRRAEASRCTRAEIFVLA